MALDNIRRADFWKELDGVRSRWNGAWCIGAEIKKLKSERAILAILALSKRRS